MALQTMDVARMERLWLRVRMGRVVLDAKPQSMDVALTVSLQPLE